MVQCWVSDLSEAFKQLVRLLVKHNIEYRDFCQFYQYIKSSLSAKSGSHFPTSPESMAELL